MRVVLVVVLLILLSGCTITVPIEPKIAPERPISDRLTVCIRPVGAEVRPSFFSLNSMFVLFPNWRMSWDAAFKEAATEFARKKFPNAAVVESWEVPESAKAGTTVLIEGKSFTPDRDGPIFGWRSCALLALTVERQGRVLLEKRVEGVREESHTGAILLCWWSISTWWWGKSWLSEVATGAFEDAFAKLDRAVDDAAPGLGLSAAPVTRSLPPPDTSAEASAPAPKSEGRGLKFCSECGAKVGRDAKFCDSCGAKR